MTPELSRNPIVQLSVRYSEAVERARMDIATFSGLHPDFISDCLSSISRKECRAGSPLLGELFPHLVAESLRIDDAQRRRLAAAWVALYGYISLVDFQLDRNGFLDARTSVSSSAILGWGIATISEIAAGTSYFAIFSENIRAAFAGQYLDLQHRTDPSFDRSTTDIDKNRAILAIVAGYCAAAAGQNDRLIRATELALGPFQLLDDLLDLKEDLQEGNITLFAKIVREIIPNQTTPNQEQSYRAIFSDTRIVTSLHATVDALSQATIMLSIEQDWALIWYFSQLRSQISALIEKLDYFQAHDASITEADLYADVQKLYCNS